MQRKQGSTSYPILFFMADSADHVTAKTGLTPVVTLCKNGGAFGAAAGAVSEIANGWYALAGNATDRDTLGELALHAAAAGADPADRYCEVVSWDPYSQAFDNLTTARLTLLDALSYVTSGGVTIMPPVLSDGRLALVAGDSYANAEGRALEWTSTGQPWPTDLAGYTITLYAGPITKVGSVVVATGTRKVRVELTKAETLVAKSENYVYKLVATKGLTEQATLANGEMWIR